MRFPRIIADRGHPMPRLSLATAIPPLLIAVLVVLFLHRAINRPDTPAPAPTTAAYREAMGGNATGGSIEPPSANAGTGPSAMNPVPAGTPNVEPAHDTPSSATPTAPSGEPAKAPAGGG